MNINEYEDFIKRSSFYRKIPMTKLVYPALAMAGEAGEFANYVKKTMRGDFTVEEVKKELVLELGDVLFYIIACGQDIGVSIQEIVDANVEKLRVRQASKIG